MITLKTTIKDLGAKTGLKELEKRLTKPQQALKECGLVLLRSIAKTFKAGGRPVRWTPSRRANRSRGQTLVNTARLKNSITLRVFKKKLKVGTNVKYAAIQHLGGHIEKTVAVKKHRRFITQAFGKPIKGRKVLVKSHDRKMNTQIPARPYLVIQKADYRMFTRIIGDYLTQ